MQSALCKKGSFGCLFLRLFLLMEGNDTRDHATAGTAHAPSFNVTGYPLLMEYPITITV